MLSLHLSRSVTMIRCDESHAVGHRSNHRSMGPGVPDGLMRSAPHHTDMHTPSICH